MSTITFQTPACPSTPQRLVAEPTMPRREGAEAAEPRDEVRWSKALQLPGYVYGTGAAALSGLYGFSQRFPYGGVTINPNGIVLNPEWTRHFAPDTLAAHAQPVMATVATGLFAVRGCMEFYEGIKHDDNQAVIAATVDIGLATASLLQVVYPCGGAAATLALTAVRGLMEAVQA